MSRSEDLPGLVFVFGGSSKPAMTNKSLFDGWLFEGGLVGNWEEWMEIFPGSRELTYG